MEEIKEESRKQSTANILAAIAHLGGGVLDTPETMVRAALIDVLEEREGEQVADKVMQSLGMM